MKYSECNSYVWWTIFDKYHEFFEWRRWIEKCLVLSIDERHFNKLERGNLFLVTGYNYGIIIP